MPGGDLERAVEDGRCDRMGNFGRVYHVFVHWQAWRVPAFKVREVRRWRASHDSTWLDPSGRVYKGEEERGIADV